MIDIGALKMRLYGALMYISAPYPLYDNHYNNYYLNYYNNNGSSS